MTRLALLGVYKGHQIIGKPHTLYECTSNIQLANVNFAFLEQLFLHRSMTVIEELTQNTSRHQSKKVFYCAQLEFTELRKDTKSPVN